MVTPRAEVSVCSYQGASGWLGDRRVGRRMLGTQERLWNAPNHVHAEGKQNVLPPKYDS